MPWFNVVAEFSSRGDWTAEEHNGYCTLLGQSQCEFFLKLRLVVSEFGCLMVFQLTLISYFIIEIGARVMHDLFCSKRWIIVVYFLLQLFIYSYP